MTNTNFMRSAAGILLVSFAGAAFATPISSEISLNTLVGFDPVDTATFTGNSDSGSFYDSTSSITSPFTGSTSATSTQDGSTIESVVAVESNWNDSLSGDLTFTGDVAYEHTSSSKVDFAWNMFGSTWDYTFSHDNSGQFILNWDASVTVDGHEYSYTDATFSYQINGVWEKFDRDVSTIVIDVTDPGTFEFGIGWNPYGPNGSGFYSYPASFNVQYEMLADWEFVQDPIEVPEPSIAIILLSGIAGLVVRKVKSAK